MLHLSRKFSPHKREDSCEKKEDEGSLPRKHKKNSSISAGSRTNNNNSSSVSDDSPNESEETGSLHDNRNKIYDYNSLANSEKKKNILA
jgi:hypothetical protein